MYLFKHTAYVRIAIYIMNIDGRSFVLNILDTSRSLSTLSIATNANLLNLPLSSLALTIKPNPLELPHDRKHRQETYNKLNQLIFGIRQQKLKVKKREIYAIPPLVKQIIRCLYPSDIDDNNCLQKPDIVFNLKAFIELFRV
ncbi:unnamed protein product [Rotaria socialis]|uniref:Uncharacterized protein n=1 Tax=Rotaria socialis TaxID=392032 RepID=A0A821Q633_9BILA|nr:unnamed protein product [Rotaria socialis]